MNIHTFYFTFLHTSHANNHYKLMNFHLFILYVSCSIEEDLYIHGVAMKIPERFYCKTSRKPCNLIIVKTWLCMFLLAPITISMHQRHLCVNCGTYKMCLIKKQVIGFYNNKSTLNIVW